MCQGVWLSLGGRNSAYLILLLGSRAQHIFRDRLHLSWAIIIQRRTISGSVITFHIAVFFRVER